MNNARFIAHTTFGSPHRKLLLAACRLNFLCAILLLSLCTHILRCAVITFVMLLVVMCIYSPVHAAAHYPRALLLHFGCNLYLLRLKQCRRVHEREWERRTMLYIYSFELIQLENAISTPCARARAQSGWKRLRAIFILRLIYFLQRMQVAHIFHSGEQLNYGVKCFLREKI